MYPFFVSLPLESDCEAAAPPEDQLECLPLTRILRRQTEVDVVLQGIAAAVEGTVQHANGGCNQRLVQVCHCLVAGSLTVDGSDNVAAPKVGKPAWRSRLHCPVSQSRVTRRWEPPILIMHRNADWLVESTSDASTSDAVVVLKQDRFRRRSI